MALTGAGTAVIRRVVDIVSAATLGPRSAGVLFLDMDPQVLRVIAERIVEDFASFPGRRIVTLGPWANDTDLWVAGTFAADGIGLEPGLLAERPYRKPAVVVVPDLAAAGVSVQRAAIAVLDTSVAYVERSGRSMRWKPTCLWLAAVSREDAAHLSPHLLDRFPYRVDAAGMDEELRARYRENAAAPAADDWASAMPRFPADTMAVLPAMTDTATRRIVEAVPAGPSRRRDLALAQVALTLAARASQSEVTPEHVDQAAELLGFVRPLGPADEAPPEPAGEPEHPAQPDVTDDLDTERWEDAEPGVLWASASGDPRPFDTAEAEPPVVESYLTPYPEDHPDALAPQRSLALGGGRKRIRQRRGRPIGSMPTRDPREIALLPTLFEAALFQPARRRHATGEAARRLAANPDALLVGPADLRRHRRRVETAAALVLVLDHTCRHGWDWAPALAPQLRWAYEHRAAVTIVEFGHRDAATELVAERYRAKSLHDPRVPESLAREPGRATPLAHAIDLTGYELRRLLRRGRTGVESARLVIVSDARGNVPLDASLRGLVPQGVGRQGVDDALEAARALRTLDRVEALVIAPEVDQYAGLPADLAEALDARLLVPTTRRTGP